MHGALLCNSESVNTVLVLTLIEGHKIYNALLAIVVIMITIIIVFQCISNLLL